MTRADERPARAALEGVLADGASAQSMVHELLGERGLWWKSCEEAVRADPAWLFGTQCEDLRGWLAATTPGRVTYSVAPVDHAFLLSRALSAPPERIGEHEEALHRLTEAWGQSRLLMAAAGSAQPTGKGLDGLSPHVAGGLSAVVERVREPLEPAAGSGSTTGPTSMLVISALLLVGAVPRRRPVVSLPVVFGDAAERAEGVKGVTGVLELREFPAGPAGLYPDPRAMAGTRSPNGQFAASLGRAWEAAGPRREGRCVLWRIVLSDDPEPPARIEGPSLGAAFALGLREILRFPPSRRLSTARLRGIFYSLRPRTAVTGALDGGERLLKVSDMDAKLLAARRKRLRLVAPEANRLDVLKAPEPGEVRFAETLRQADRYARRLRTGRLAVAVSLLVATATAGLVVKHQDAAALSQLTNAHQLADISKGLLQSDAGLAELFAVQAYQYHADALTRQALFQAVTASPHLVGSVRASGQVSKLAAAANGRAALVGTQNGEVEEFTLTGATLGPGRQLGRLPGAVTAVAADADGRTVAAIGNSTVRAWVAGRPVATRIPAGQKPTALAVSPSGRYIAVTTTTDIYSVPPILWILDQTTGTTSRLTLTDIPGAPTAVAFPSDTQLVAFEDGYGTWDRISLPHLVRTAGSTVGFGVHNSASALAPDGSYFTYSNTASPLPIWESDGSPNIDKPTLLAETQAGHPEALAISNSGTWAADAVDTSIYVSRTTLPGQTPTAPIALNGAGEVSPDALAFLGSNGNRLISASGDLLSLWDLTQYSRIATEAGAVIPISCDACRGPSIAVSPDGHSASVIDGNGVALDIQRLDPPGADRQATEEPLLSDAAYSAALWKPDGSSLIVVAPDGSAQILTPVQKPLVSDAAYSAALRKPGKSGLIVVPSDGSTQILTPTSGFRVTGTWPPVPGPPGTSALPAILQFLPGDQQVAELDSSGTIRFRDAATGSVLRQVAGPQDMTPATQQLNQGFAALDSQAAHAAVIDNTFRTLLNNLSPNIVVTDTATGHARTIPDATAVGVAYAGNHLLVQLKNGSLEIWDASGSQHLETIEATPDTSVGPAIGGNLIAEKPANDTVQLIDLPSGSILGTLTLPAGSKPLSTGLAFSPDGTELVTATETSGSILVPGDIGELIDWQLDPTVWAHIACATVGQDLTPDLWRQYVDTNVPSNLKCTP